MKSRLAIVSLVVCIAQGLLILLSWMLTALFPDLPMHSMLSPEGIRWFMGHFATSLSTPLLVWIAMAAVAYGAVSASGLAKAMTLRHRQRGFRDRFALRMALSILAVVVVVMVLLTAVPQAILLSVTGSLFPSSFLQSIVPVSCFTLALMGLVYGISAGTFRKLTDTFDALTVGFGRLSPLFLLYILCATLYISVRYVFFS